MKFKKYLALYIVIVILGTCLSVFCVDAAGSLTIAVGNSSAAVGENVTVNVTTSSVSNIGGIVINLKYDSTYLEYVSSTKGAAMTMGYVAVVHRAADKQVRLTATDGSNPWATSGVILSVTFKILNGASGSIPVTLDRSTDIVDFQANKVVPTITDGSVSVLVPLTELVINKTSLALSKGENETLSVTKNPSNTTETGNVIWSSSNTSVATVVDGVVTAVGGGSAEIKAAILGGKSVTCSISVTSPLTRITINKSTISINKGQKEVLSVAYEPTDTTVDKTVTWTSSDSNVASVSNGTVTANKAGTATITATVTGKKAECIVNVIEKKLESISLDNNSIEIGINGTKTLRVIYSPTDTTDSKTVIWTSSDSSIATVTNGVVKGVKEGTTEITAKVGDKTAKCTVKITSSVVVSITGQLFDEKGKPLANMNVELHSEVKTTLTDTNGFYKFDNVELGSHVLTVKKQDGTVISTKNLEIVVGTTTSISDDIITVGKGDSLIKLSTKINGNDMELSEGKTNESKLTSSEGITSSDDTSSKNENKKGKNEGIFVIVIVFIVLVVAGVVTFIYFRRKPY